MNYRLNGKDYEVVIIHKNNKSTYTRVKEDLKIYVTTNYFVSKQSVKKMLDDNVIFLEKMIDKINKKKERATKFYFLGQVYDIIIVPTLDSIDVDGKIIYVKSSVELNKWLLLQMKDIFKTRLSICYNLFEESIPYPQLKIRKMTSRWGVCNRKTIAITLNANLIKEAIEVIDYVIIHELSHFVCFDHSKNFWMTVYKYCPNYKKIKKHLKE